MLGESRETLTCADSQRSERDIEIFTPKISSWLHLQEIQNTNEESGHKNAKDNCELLFTILNFFDEVFNSHKKIKNDIIL